MENRLVLSKRFSKILEALPENGMGYQIADIELKNGKILEKRLIFNSNLLKLDKEESLKNKDIQKIKLTEK